MSIDRFEDLDCWQKGRELANTVYEMTATGKVAKDFGLRDQLSRAAVSVMANIAEGYERGSNRDFIRFLFMARGFAGEVRSLLYVAGDRGYIGPQELTDCKQLAITCSKLIWGLIKALRDKEDWQTGVKEEAGEYPLEP